jgi:hypothetical protein
MTKEQIQGFNEYYAVVGQVYSALESRIKFDKDRSKYTYTCNALYYAIIKIEEIVATVERQKQSSSYYVNKILFRSAIEIFLVGYYISFKCELESSDQCGRDYYNAYEKSERLKQVGYDLRVDGKINKIPNNDNLANIQAILPFAKSFTQSDIQKIHMVANQFDIRTIIIFLLEHPGTFGHLVNTDAFVAVVKHYNILSSYVHGGVTSEKEAFVELNDSKKQEDTESSLAHTKLLAYGLKLELILHLWQENKKEYTSFTRYLDTFMGYNQMRKEDKDASQ